MRTLLKLTVSDAYQLDDTEPISVKPREAFSQVIYNFAHHVELRGIIVVDDEDRFMGLVTRTDLLDWVSVKLGAVFAQPLKDAEKTIRLANLINALTVGDVLRPETKGSTVYVNDTLARALEIMIQADLIILPVIDESEKVLGSLSLSELLTCVLGEANN